MASRFENDERENVDITGAYLFGESDFDKSKPTFGLIVNPLGRRCVSEFCPQYNSILRTGIFRTKEIMSRANMLINGDWLMIKH